MNMQNPGRFLDRGKVFIAQNPDWTIVNNGGSGDCAFRCAAYSIAKQQQKDLGPEAMIREGSRLRLDISLHIRHHKAIFEPFSAPDSAEANLFRANQEAPAEYADYVLAASHRDYYADDLLLNALAERFLTPIIVFAWSTTRQIWEPSVVCSQFQDGRAFSSKKGFKPIILMQSDNPLLLPIMR